MGFTETMKKAGQAVKKSVSEVTDALKSEYKKGQLKNELSEIYKTLGEVRYAELISGGEITEESVELCKEITRVKNQLKNLEKDDDNVNKCKVCAKKLPDNITYCPYCGTKTEEKEEK